MRHDFPRSITKRTKVTSEFAYRKYLKKLNTIGLIREIMANLRTYREDTERWNKLESNMQSARNVVRHNHALANHYKEENELLMKKLKIHVLAEIRSKPETFEENGL